VFGLESFGKGHERSFSVCVCVEKSFARCHTKCTKERRHVISMQQRTIIAQLIPILDVVWGLVSGMHVDGNVVAVSSSWNSTLPLSSLACSKVLVGFSVSPSMERGLRGDRERCLRGVRERPEKDASSIPDGFQSVSPLPPNQQTSFPSSSTISSTRQPKCVTENFTKLLQSFTSRFCHIRSNVDSHDIELLYYV
jgi:hypothetical protein